MKSQNLFSRKQNAKNNKIFHLLKFLHSKLIVKTHQNHLCWTNLMQTTMNQKIPMK